MNQDGKTQEPGLLYFDFHNVASATLSQRKKRTLSEG